MRTVCVISLVLLCMAASIRIDGVWPPAPIHDHFLSLLKHAAEPGKAVSALLDDRIHVPPRPEALHAFAPAFSLEIVERPAPRKPTGTDCG